MERPDLIDIIIEEPARELTGTIGKQILAFIRKAGHITFFLWSSINSLFTPPFFFRQIVKQAYQIGVTSFPLVAVCGFAIGLVMAMQTIGVLTRFGAVYYMASVVGLSMVRELGPVFTAIMVAGRAGSGIAAELGSMKVTYQIDALRVMAINPINYLVTPRLWAAMLMLPLLTIMADFLGIFGGFLIGITQGGINPEFYYNITIKYIQFKDFLPGLLKTIPFGFIVAGVASYEGFNTSGGTEGVGISTTTAVVVSCLSILISDVFLTKATILIFG